LPRRAPRGCVARRRHAQCHGDRDGVVGSPSRDPQACSSVDERGGRAMNIETRIQQLGDWRGRMLAKIRTVITRADPEVLEEWKWAKPTSPGVPVWSHDGIICTGEVYKDKVKMTFARGAALPDPSRLFNSSLDGGTRRAIDLREGDVIEEPALRE